MSDHDREYWRKVARDAPELESHTPASPEQRRRIFEWVNPKRIELGLPPFEEDEDPPELEFYRIAKARGLLRRPDTDPR